MVREFKLINETGQAYSLMDIENYALLTEPSGLGYSYENYYEQIGNNFMENIRRLEQGTIEGTLNFKKYDNFSNLINFIETAEKLRFVYSVPYENQSVNKVYYRDVQIQSLSKTEKQPNGIITENITLKCLSLWYEEKETVKNITKQDREIRWNFTWDSKFTGYDNRTVTLENTGHTQAPFLLEIDGYLINPCISIYVDNNKVNELKLDITIREYEKVWYSTKDNDLYILKENIDGTKENIFNFLDINNNNFFKIPKGVSEIRLTADNEITSAKLTVYVEYKAV